jgi:hypothetical protein
MAGRYQHAEPFSFTTRELASSYKHIKLLHCNSINVQLNAHAETGGNRAVKKYWHRNISKSTYSISYVKFL